MTCSARRPIFLMVLALLLPAALAGCVSSSAPAAPVFEFTSGFVKNPRGGWVASAKDGKILAVTRAYEAAHGRDSKKPKGDADLSISPTFSTVELLSYALFEGTSEDCPFGNGDTGSYRYIAGRHWPRQRKHWVDATCDATVVIMQEIVHQDSTLTDRVYLLWDGRPATDPPSQITVTLVNSPGVSQVLTCSSAAQECYVETNDGLTLSPPIPLHQSATGAALVSHSAANEAFVSCVVGQAATAHITDALRWQTNSKGAYKDQAGGE